MASKANNAARLEAAFATLAKADATATRADLAATPERAATLWQQHILAGAELDPTEALGRGMPTQDTDPIALTGIGMHLVCPHHLTVALGHADLVYLPGGRLVGLGRLSRLVQACTARLILQEDAGQWIATVLVEHLKARAALVRLTAWHPCHSLLHPRSHDARAVTWSTAGNEGSTRQLRRVLLASLTSKS